MHAEGARHPNGGLVLPLLPFLNDTEENLRGILSYCFEAGVKGILCFGIGVTMRGETGNTFIKSWRSISPA